ncbi:transcription termination factor 1-like isoform X2 [Dendropsophus ebraccatus]
MTISPGQKYKGWDGASDYCDTEGKVKKKKRKIISLDVMYTGSSDVQETPKRKKYMLNSETQDMETNPLTPKRKTSGDIYIEEHKAKEASLKKKRHEAEREAYGITADGASSSTVHHQQQYNQKIKKSHGAKDTKRLNKDEFVTEETSYSENTNLQDKSKEKKKNGEEKRKKKDNKEQLLDNSSVEESLTIHNQHRNKKKKKQKDGEALQGDEGMDEDVDQSEPAVKKKKKKDGRHQEADDITADNGAPSSIVLYEEENQSIKKSHKTKDLKRLHKDEKFIEESLSSKMAIPESRSEKKKKLKKDHGEQYLDNGLIEEPSTIDTQHVKKKKKKRKGGEDLQGDGSAEESCSRVKSPGETETSEQVDESQDLSEKTVEKKKKKDDYHQDDMAVDDTASSSVYQEQNKKIKRSHKAEDPKRLSRDDRLPEVALYKEPANIKDSQSLKKKKKKLCLLVDSSAEELLTTDAQHANNKKTKRKDGGDESHKQQDFTEEREKKRKQQDDSKSTVQVGETMDQAADRSVETSLISDTQQVKKKKKQKDGGSVQKDGLTEELNSHRKSSDGSETQEQVDGSRYQTEKPKKKKKKRKDESPQGVEDIAVDDVSLAAPCGDEASYYTEDRTRHKKKKSKKHQSECPVEESNHDAQCTIKKKREKTKRKDGGDESHGPHETETVDQAEVYVRKKKKKHSKRREETQPKDDAPAEVDQSSHSQETAVKMEGDREHDTEQTSTSGQSRHQTSVPTGAEQNPTTQGNREEVHNEGGDRPNSSVNIAEKIVRRQQRKPPSIRKQDLVLIREYFPHFKSPDKMKRALVTHELERLRIAKQKGILYRTGHFTTEEDELIKKNVEKFISQVGIQSAVMLFHPYKFPEHSKTVNQIKRKFNFTQRIADGLYRLSSDVIERGAKLFHFATRTGRYTEEEVRQLKKYHELHGKDYQAISVLMSRSQESSYFKINDIIREASHGPWSTDETNCLITAVKEFILDSLQKENNSTKVPVTILKRKLYKGIKWVQIQDKVGTRGWTLCKAHWTNIISMRMNYGVHPFKGELGKLTSIRMIKWMRDAKVRDYGDVKWDQLCDSIGNVTSFGAQLKFIKLKQQIAGYKDKRLYEIVDILYEKVMPELEAEVSLSLPPKPEIREEFLFSEMFREYSEYDEM